MLETLGDPTIHRLAIEEAEKNETGWFDPQKEISDMDYAEIYKSFNDYKTSKSWEALAQIGSDLKKLGYNPDLTPDEKTEMIKHLNEFQVSVDPAAFIHFASHVHDLGLGNFATPEKADLVRERLEELRTTNLLAAAIFGLDFKKMGFEFEFTPEEVHVLGGMLSKYRETNTWMFFIWLASIMKELRLPVHLEVGDVEKMLERFNYKRDRNKWGDFTTFAVRLFSISRNEVNLEDRHPLPEERKF